MIWLILYKLVMNILEFFTNSFAILAASIILWYGILISYFKS